VDKTVVVKLIFMNSIVYESGRIKFVPNPYSTWLRQVTGNVTHTRPNIWVRPDGLGRWLRGLDLLVRWVWALDWANFMDLHEFF